MPTIKGDVSHFVPAAEMPMAAFVTTARAAYSMMCEHPAGGLVVFDQKQPLYYITAPFLRSAVTEIARQHGPAAAALMPVGQYLRTYL